MQKEIEYTRSKMEYTCKCYICNKWYDIMHSDGVFTVVPNNTRMGKTVYVCYSCWYIKQKRKGNLNYE